MSMKDFNFDFMRHRNPIGIGSIVLVLLSVVLLATRGLNLGLDFSGGTLMELHFDQPTAIEPVRSHLQEEYFSDAVVVHFGAETEVLVRTREQLNQQEGEAVAESLGQALGNPADPLRVEFVGPQIGQELREDGGLGLLAAMLVVMLYVALRFQYKFSIGAVVALVHDVIITLGFFSLFHWEFDLTVLAAILALIGYSLNDTIVVSDRIRENFRAMRNVDPVGMVNLSLNQVLGRTIITGLTTLLVLVVLYFFGGESLKNFALALIIGIIVGTYSSIYVASSLVLALNITKQDLMPPVDLEEGEVQEEVPYS
jgi:preprotein translocase subunit SecF